MQCERPHKTVAGSRRAAHRARLHARISALIETGSRQDARVLLFEQRFKKMLEPSIIAMRTGRLFLPMFNPRASVTDTHDGFGSLRL